MTRGWLYIYGNIWNFNSHAHVERDMFLAKTHINHANISTHTLTWSVTKASSVLKGVTINFNSHAHVERDLTIIVKNQILAISTHTPTWSVTDHIKSYIRDDLFQLTRSRGA